MTPHPTLYLWIAHDRAQGNDIAIGGLHTYRLEQVMRNTKPIMEIMQTQYSEFKKTYDEKDTMPTLDTKGHPINGPPVDICVFKGKCEDVDHLISEQYLKQTFQRVLDEWEGVPAAIVYDHSD